MKSLLNKSLFLSLLFLSISLDSISMVSYNDYKNCYKPTYKLLAPDNNAVKLVNELDGKSLAPVIEVYVDEGNQEMFALLMCSIKRPLAGSVLNNMNQAKASKGLGWLKNEWQLELAWFVNENTYNYLSTRVDAISSYRCKGSGSSSGSYDAKKWSPIMAGLAYNLAYSGFKGINPWVEAYNATPNKLDPAGNLLVLEKEMNEMHFLTGFGAFTALKLNKGKLLDINFDNRKATSKAVFGDYERSVRYTINTLGLGILRSNSLGKTDVLVGYGMNVGFIGLNKKLKTPTSDPEWDEIEKYKNVGLYMKVYIQRQLLDKVPLMLTVNPYFNLNLARNDFSSLESSLPQMSFAGTSDDMKSSISNIGVQVGLAYRFASKKKAEPIINTYEPQVAEELSPYVNTKLEELAPMVSPDGRTLYFSRNNDPRNTYGASSSQDIWTANTEGNLDSAKATHLSAPFNKINFNYLAGISPDENTMMVSGAYDKGEFKGMGYSLVHRTKTGWTEPQQVEVQNFTTLCKGKYAGAFLSNDGKSLVQYFSEVAGNETYDLYVSHLNTDGSWSTPKKLGNLNTSNNEISPFLASDGVTLYYASDKSGGYGSYDIYVTKRLDDTWTKWSEPVNAGPEINSEAWDAYYSIDAQGKYAYMVSYKNKGMNGDIVRIKLKEDIRPEPVVLVKGRVLNAKTKEPLEASVQYSDLTNRSNDGIARTNPSTGEYKIVLPYGAEYSFLGEAAGFVAQSNNLDLRTKGEYKELEVDILLYPIEVGSTVRLNNIFFETGKANLDDKSQLELDRLVKLLNDNPNMSIEISGHTDNVGKAEFNLSLSQQRANSVLNYLIAKGIAKDRLKAVGYGLNKPVASNETEEGKAYNRRVEFTITKN